MYNFNKLVLSIPKTRGMIYIYFKIFAYFWSCFLRNHLSTPDSVSRTAQPPLKILFANVYGYFQKDLKSVSEFSMINEGQYGFGVINQPFRKFV